MRSAGPGKPKLTVSPLAVGFPPMSSIPGVELAVGRAGFYKHERPDLVLFHFPDGATCAGVFTRHAVGSAPVDWCRNALAAAGAAKVRALVINAGCANAFTGAAGEAACASVAEATAGLLGAQAGQVLLASTGVIGVLLDDEKIKAVLPELKSTLKADGWNDAAAAIMTTDTFAKGAVRTCRVDGVEVRVAGIAKGSGMIAPDMATMLAFVVTDADLPAALLQSLLDEAVATSFNSVTVDGDRSTNDTCLLFATGGSGALPVEHAGDLRVEGFHEALGEVLLDLALQLVRDGEGATKFIRIQVNGASDNASARKIARTVAESPLVKTAFAGEDANWGRVVMAVGRSDEPVRRERLSVRFGHLQAALDGAVAADYDEAAMSAYMKRDELELVIDVGVGDGHGVIWTCDLTKRYVEINGDYRS